MVSRVLLRKILRDLGRRKGALLALVGILMVGVGSFVGMASIFRDLDSARRAYFVQYRLADFTVGLKRAPAWAIESVARDLPNLRLLQGRVVQEVLIDLASDEEPIPGLAISLPEIPKNVLNDILLRSGSWFSGREEREVILNEAFARHHHLVPGDHLQVLILDQQHEFLIIGTAMSPEFVYLIPPDGGMAPDPGRFGAMYLREGFLQQACDLQGSYNQVLGVLDDPSPTALANTLEYIARVLHAYGVTETAKMEDQAPIRFLHDELVNLKVSSEILPTLFLAVAALVLNILLGRMVAQQRVVIGTLKAIGYSSWAISCHYLGYGVVLGTIGGAAGLGFGWLLQELLIDLYRVFFSLPTITGHTYFDIWLIGLLIAIVSSTLGTIKGVRYAVRLSPAEAMRPPPPERGGTVWAEKLLVFPVSFRGKLIVRSIFRNPFRSMVNILVSLSATALILASLCLIDAIEYLMDYHFTRLAHQELTISLRLPRDGQALEEMTHLPTISEAEPQLGVVCHLQNGSWHKRVVITGLPCPNRLYTPLDAIGKPVPIPVEGLILTRKLAEILHVQVGEAIRLQPLIAQRRETMTPVVQIVDSFLGLSGYTSISYLSRLLGEESVANALLGTPFVGAPEQELLREIKKRPFIIGLGKRRRSISQMEKTLGDFLRDTFYTLVLLSGLIAFGGVLNTALVSLSEREREVGTLRVLGYTPSQIAQSFVGESGLLNGVGIALGLIAGIALAHALSRAYDFELYRLPVVIYPSRIFFTVLWMIGFIGCAQLIVYGMIRKLEWLSVLQVKE